MEGNTKARKRAKSIRGASIIQKLYAAGRKNIECGMQKILHKISWCMMCEEEYHNRVGKMSKWDFRRNNCESIFRNQQVKMYTLQSATYN